MRIQVTLSTDGACRGNPGPGGYAGILSCGKYRKEYAGYGGDQTTNNRMELTAVIEGISLLKKPCNVVVVTDSKYVISGIIGGPTWAANGWKLKSGSRPKNVDLWKKLQAVALEGNHTISFQYVKGHNGDEDNERCDQLAKEQIDLNWKGACNE